MFDSITDQNQAVSRLMSMIRHGFVPHALLFSGLDGVGKSTTARAMAMALNCRASEASGSVGTTGQPVTQAGEGSCPCRSCRKIMAGTHPDILTVVPSGGLIKIAQIRDLYSKLLVKPLEASMRVVIIHDTHTMNQESGNALLKMLEEPPEKTMFILITDQASDVLPTILSRCQTVMFTPIPAESIRSRLVSVKGMDAERADVITCLAGGSLGKAMALCDERQNRPDPLVFRRYLFAEFEGLLKGGLFDALSFAEKLSRKKETALNALETTLSFIRDLTVFPFDRDRVLNRDIADRLENLSGRFSTDSLLHMADRVLSAHQGIKANASVRLCLETMAIQMKRI